MRVVVTTPVESPRSSARSKRVRSSWPATPAASPRATVSSTPITPARVFAPLSMAVAVPAESGVCWFVL
jgi:hypothetical protein